MENEKSLKIKSIICTAGILLFTVVAIIIATLGITEVINIRIANIINCLIMGTVVLGDGLFNFKVLNHKKLGIGLFAASFILYVLAIVVIIL